MSEYMEYNWMTNMTSSNIKNSTQSKQDDAESSIHNLRSFLKGIDDFIFSYSPDLSDHNLLKFLHARDFNVEESCQLFQRYYIHRHEKSGIFQDYNLDAADIKHCLQNCLPGILSSKDRKGRCVLLISANNWDCTCSLLSIYRSILYCLDNLINDVHNQNNGIVFIIDWTEFSFRRSLNLKPSVLRLMIEGFQNCFPAKFKGIHFVNQPWYVEAALTCLKPFLKGDITNRIFFHGNNLSTLHEYVHKDILPTELGGEQPSLNPQASLNVLNDVHNNI